LLLIVLVGDVRGRLTRGVLGERNLAERRLSCWCSLAGGTTVVSLAKCPYTVLRKALR
jgi:hypothetical protein